MTSERYSGPIPPQHAEREGPGPMPRCPFCARVIDPQGNALGKGRCSIHGYVPPVYGDREAILERAER